MDLEHRVQMLEEEVQILKNQIQATLLDIQEHLLTNKYPALRSENTAVPEISSPPSRPTAPVAAVPVQQAPLVEPAIEPPIEPEQAAPAPAVIRKVTLDSITPPANSARTMEPELPPARYAEELPPPPWYADPAPQPSRFTEPDPPRYSRRTGTELQPPTRMYLDSPSEPEDGLPWNTDPDGFVIPPAAAKHPVTITPFESPELLSPFSSGAQPFVVDDDLPPSLGAETRITEADWATLTQLQEWTIKRVKALGPDRARLLIKRYAQDKRISEHVKDTLLQLVTIAVAESSESGERPSTPPKATRTPTESPPRQESDEGVTPRLITRLIAGIQESGAATMWRDKNG